jgi:hypothetical protein
MERVCYDADSQVYTFRDADGSFWESAPGNQYGELTEVGTGTEASRQFRLRNPQFFPSPSPRPAAAADTFTEAPRDTFAPHETFDEILSERAAARRAADQRAGNNQETRSCLNVLLPPVKSVKTILTGSVSKTLGMAKSAFSRT